MMFNLLLVFEANFLSATNKNNFFVKKSEFPVNMLPPYKKTFVI